jgi:hypothetical protein
MNGSSRYYVVKSESAKFGVGFGSALRHRDQLHQQPVDHLGDHPRPARLAVRDLRCAVPVVVENQDGGSEMPALRGHRLGLRGSSG